MAPADNFRAFMSSYLRLYGLTEYQQVPVALLQRVALLWCRHTLAKGCA